MVPLGIRTAILDTQIEEEITPTTRVWASGLSAGLSFAVVGAVTRMNQLQIGLATF
jgi:hypothetical protein